ncbi:MULTISPECIES: DUF2949 domain-containing protein [Okeania]|uniref:DUF2949 domain-containing protein n=1 Tax=Okeania hirsuta TaxID=1458930 RepID=A0A3N6P9T1_9CYAN|nr:MULTISPECIES: DUF2949 domain-containing protein [Okeania]NEP38985.1 DUF2949 domain-containing protein [Okeania sp. SIO2H7]NET14697.1 DUF2949 domain-containing protein [Okeania sp. SIO1H6]NEP71748.1 DUF2949 domain-containing protein [Okeania sp. SIO2G5]NEP88608.1 DUF2949 domain-containing protein [Okeania sp. SIO2C2]NEP92480.1 DUF2949 domain-containing protein [Okeania sp. SIO2F5]
MTPNNYARFIHFLKDDLSISSASIAVAERASISSTLVDRKPDFSAFPMILWQYGLVTLEQLDKIFDWLETTYDFN